MNKILVVGNCGAGKSFLSKKMAKILGYPLLHLDRIYHIDNENKISREELMEHIYEFDKRHEKWIIDGLFKSTFERRILLCDTVVFLDIDTQTCINNVYKRSLQSVRDDMADGFDSSIIEESFIDSISDFKDNVQPKMLETIKSHPDKKLIMLEGYEAIDAFLEDLVQKLEMNFSSHP